MVHIALVAIWGLSAKPQHKSAAKTVNTKPSAYSEMFDPFAVKRPETPEQEAERAHRNTVVISQPQDGVNSISLGEIARELRDKPSGR
jgi:hypothetical protein